MIITLFSRATLAVTLALCVSWTSGASAQIPARDRYASLVVEARNGQVLSAANADETRHPASLTKMMTLYMLFEAMRDGRLNLGTPIRVSAEAASVTFETNMAADGVQGTPTIFINGEMHSNMAWEDLKTLLDAELAG